MPTPPPDPRGLKYPFQGTRVYYAATQDPGDNGGWTLAGELQFESLHAFAGMNPNLCLIRELPAGATPKRKATVNSEEAPTGNYTTGTLFCGDNISVDSLVKVEAQPIGSTDWKPIFLGVVMKPKLDLNSMTIIWPCHDYREFMKTTPLYGRTIYDPDSGATVYIKAARMTFNEHDKPDRGQMGTTLTPDGTDLSCWVPQCYNRADELPASTAANPEEAWADYWLAGHIWNYLRATYFLATPTEIDYLSLGDFINMPEASETAGDDLYWLFNDATLGRVICSDFALTGGDMAKAITPLLEKAGPYDWTLVPNSDGDTCDIVPFNVHEGLGDPLDFVWGDYQQNVYAGTPDIDGGYIERDRSDYHNRGFAVSRRTCVETTLTTRAALFAAGAPASLIMDATAADVGDATSGWLKAYSKGNTDVDLYPNVYRRFRVPDGYDWATYVFNGDATQAAVAGYRGALAQLITRGGSFEDSGGLDPAPVFRPMKPQVWRNKNVGGSPTWERLPSNMGFEVLWDRAGIWLSDNVRTGDTPWIWNGDVASPVVYELAVTLAIETDALMSSAVNKQLTGERVREYFLDGGNTYRPCERINAMLPVDGSGNPTTNNPVSIGVFGSPAAPSFYADRAAALSAELAYRMEMKNAPVISGHLPLWGMRFDPWPLGYLFGTMTNSADEPVRPELQLNACIRGFKITRNPPSTALELDGR